MSSGCDDPRITIIIPVYNVEKYLRQCLDSAVNQTMREIEILCIDDGSTDRSLEILREYAAKDKRIHVLVQQNCGPAITRNNALRLAKGQYIIFLDSDDWCELTLCEQAYQKACETNAEMVFFFLRRPGNLKRAPQFDRISVQDKTTPQQKKDIVNYAFPVLKVYSHQFLKDNQITFPEHLFFEDIPFHWKALVLARKIAILPQTFYNYRVRSDSTIESRGRHYTDIVPILERVKTFLVESGNYKDYKDIFIRYKLDILQINYQHILDQHKPEMKQLILDTFGDDEREYCREGKKLNTRARLFFRALQGNRTSAVLYRSKIILFNLERFFVGLSRKFLPKEKCES